MQCSSSLILCTHRQVPNETSLKIIERLQYLHVAVVGKVIACHPTPLKLVLYILLLDRAYNDDNDRLLDGQIPL